MARVGSGHLPPSNSPTKLRFGWTKNNRSIVENSKDTYWLVTDCTWSKAQTPTGMEEVQAQSRPHIP